MRRLGDCGAGGIKLSNARIVDSDADDVQEASKSCQQIRCRRNQAGILNAMPGVGGAFGDQDPATISSASGTD
ncbi:MAG: hypothetical protein A3E01_00025 [Gammaproteobacteria bacterium RIFCSPHIGHO2_12_FULL_63_22]|nr:MAG: hypothetical protein A3E01_00025 [Gammaproteobacteria bacterium RIFCSPHIGHO2_12_FULL_63_22]